MEKIINELINCSINGVDVYRYNNATWLIFTDESRWVVELTDGGTLWYNYKFFNGVMKYVSMDAKEYEGYITLWANDYFFKGVSKTEQRGYNHGDEFEWHTRAVMNNGIKEIKPNIMDMFNSNSHLYVDHDCNANKTEIWKIVEEGVKNTYPDMIPGDYNWEDEFDADKAILLGHKV